MSPTGKKCRIAECVLKSPIFVIQKAFHQKSIFAIRCSPAKLYNDVQHGTTLLNFLGKLNKTHAQSHMLVLLQPAKIKQARAIFVHQGDVKSRFLKFWKSQFLTQFLNIFPKCIKYQCIFSITLCARICRKKRFSSHHTLCSSRVIDECKN